MTMDVAFAWLTFTVWTYLMVGRGGFWRAEQRDDRGPEIPEPKDWPDVVAIVPARNEAAVIGQSVGSLLAQDYPGNFSIVVVDDNSEDGTAAEFTRIIAGTNGQVQVVSGASLPAGWTGKLWALSQGVAAAGRAKRPPKYLLLTDADIVHTPQSLRRLVARAEAGGLLLTSLMVRLRCRSFAERALIPAFVFFFQMLYPFAWVNQADRRVAAAAGGCALVQREALAAAGGLAALRTAMIDDCALAALLKPAGPIWLGLTERAESIRAYHSVQDIRRMVSRSAYAQLHYSPLLLFGTVLGMALTYFAPPLVTLLGSPAAWPVAALAWFLMSVAFLPMLLFYRRPPIWALLLPAIAATYLAFTLDSAWQHLRGRGGLWKGRVQAPLARSR
jgi:hopene-associated glycosyltransferase HpnB